LFTEKGTTGALIRALAVDFLGAIDIAQVRNKESASVKKFDVTEFPTLVLIPSADAEPKIYTGDLKKKPITEFLSQAAAPNPDASPRSASNSNSKPKPNRKSKPASKPTSVVDDAEDLKPTASQDQDETDPSEKPVQVPIPAPPIPTLATPESVESACLTPKSGTCVLVILPETGEPDAALPASATEALASIAEIGHKHALRGTHLFPLYAVPAINTASKTLRDALELADGQTVEIIALNARRGWWRRFSGAGADFGAVAVESWVDAIRLGDGAKEKLPEGIVVSVEAEVKPEAEAETVETEAETKGEAEEQTAEHDEL
jgi:protein disulfide-isomerase A6